MTTCREEELDLAITFAFCLINNLKCIIVITKAFDSVWHKGILFKLNKK